MRAVRIQHTMTLEPRAACERCDWTHGPSLQTRERAIHHAEKRGHSVLIIVERIEFWRPEG